uniref:Uncharacterized protein n=1 Tax=viral metagenome TaxID=1070528 RepID=A0A6C0FLB7_9ZZZZ|tara:strand:+ start:122 stop:715 length:594 start_codon:yes stop_codon:yes gene_type:complete
MGGISLSSREQEKKKVFFQLGNRFGLPKELIIYLYQVLMNSIKHDMDLEINFRINILSSHLCGPSAISYDMDELFTLNNPFQFRFPIGRGNEWLIQSNEARREDIFYHGCYNQLKPRDIICQQIKIYGDYHFLLRQRIIRCREYYESLEDMYRVRFIDDVGVDLFDHYWEHLDDNAYNLICQGDTYEETWLDFVEQD